MVLKLKNEGSVKIGGEVVRKINKKMSNPKE